MNTHADSEGQPPERDDADQARQEAAAKDDKPAKKPGPLRKSALIILLIIFVGGAATLWLCGDAYLQNWIRQSITAQQIDIGEATRIDTRIFDGSIDIQSAEFSQSKAEQKRVIYAASRTAVDLAVLDTLFTQDLVFDRLIAENAALNLRRYEDGSLPPVVEDKLDEREEATEQPAEAEQARDWVALWERSKQWRERLARAESGDADAEEAGKQQPAQPSSDGWEHARRYYPAPAPDQRSLPRALIKTLKISDGSVQLPDGSAGDAGPFDIDTLSIEGQNVATALDPGEEMRLNARFGMHAAGGGELELRRERGSGELQLAWQDMPLPALCDPRVLGDSLGRYGPRGQAGCSVDARWQDGVLKGELVVQLLDFALEPGADAPNGTAEVQQAIAELRKLHDRIAPDEPFVLTWRLQLGGAPWAPTITNLGLDSLGGALADARDQLMQKAKDAVKQKTDEAKQAAGQELEGLKQDLEEGKDPTESGKQRLENLEEAGKKLFDR